MPSLKDIRKRVASVKNTQKITRAMKLVSGAKLRRAQNAMMELRPYAQKQRELLGSLVAQLAQAGEESVHPLLTARLPSACVAILGISSDRGMCGGFNASNIRRTLEAIRAFEAEGKRVIAFTLGKRMGNALRKANVTMGEDFGDALTAPDPTRVRAITRRLVDGFVQGEFDEVLISSSRFKNALLQVPTRVGLLPVPAVLPEGSPSGAGGDALYEPDQQTLLDYIVPRFVEVQVRQAILESIAGEHAARMNAMSSATDNASKMIQSLTLQMNRARQAAITKELMEIIGGSEAMK